MDKLRNHPPRKLARFTRITKTEQRKSNIQAEVRQETFMFLTLTLIKKLVQGPHTCTVDLYTCRFVNSSKQELTMFPKIVTR